MVSYCVSKMATREVLLFNRENARRTCASPSNQSGLSDARELSKLMIGWSFQRLDNLCRSEDVLYLLVRICGEPY